MPDHGSYATGAPSSNFKWLEVNHAADGGRGWD